MELTKQAISNIRLTCVQNKYYIAQEVDDLLDDLSESADRLQQKAQEQSRLSDPEREELMRLRKYEMYAREEIQRLREHADVQDHTGGSTPDALHFADRQAQDIVERAKMEREAILRDARRKHERIVAANRCAYYSALQFKQDLLQQFEELESQLDLAMNALVMAGGAQPRITAGASGGSVRPGDESGVFAEKGNTFV